jgi:hypothetical protein
MLSHPVWIAIQRPPVHEPSPARDGVELKDGDLTQYDEQRESVLHLVSSAICAIHCELEERADRLVALALLSKLSDDAAHAALRFALGLFDEVLERVGIDESSSAACGGDDVIAFELLVGPCHGVWIELEIARELANGRKRSTGRELAVQNAVLDLCGDLLVYGAGIGRVDANLHIVLVCNSTK